MQLASVPLLFGGDRHAFGVDGGVAYTPYDEFDGAGWSLSGYVESKATEYWALRTTVGGVFLEADVDDRHPNANYAYATVGLAAQDLFSLVGGAGVYYVMLQEPLLDEAEYKLKPGLYGGVMFSVPYHHRYFITSGLTAHHVFADGPDFFVTFTGGFVF